MSGCVNCITSYFDFLYDDNGGFRIVPKQIHLDRRTITKKLVADVRRLTGDMLPEQMENHIERWACELKKDVNAFLVSCVLSLSE